MNSKPHPHPPDIPRQASPLKRQIAHYPYPFTFLFCLFSLFSRDPENAFCENPFFSGVPRKRNDILLINYERGSALENPGYYCGRGFFVLTGCVLALCVLRSLLCRSIFGFSRGPFLCYVALFFWNWRFTKNDGSKNMVSFARAKETWREAGMPFLFYFFYFTPFYKFGELSNKKA